jgi:hypothetical protein
MAAGGLWFRGEGFGLIIAALLALPPDQGVIAEGFRLLPHLVKPLLHDPNHCVWLIPTPEFRLVAFESRGTMWSIPNKTSNPKRALSNLLERDRLFPSVSSAWSRRPVCPPSWWTAV